METRARHLLVGSFVLVAVAAALVFVVWLSGWDGEETERLYDIYFDGSVSGLAVGGEVRYRGIPVGSVDSLGIDPDNPRRVLTTVQITSDMRIREGDMATLLLQGITGSSYINIQGAGPEDPFLEAEPGRERPVIPSRESPIAEILDEAPDLVSQGVIAVERLSALVDEQNQENIAGILADLKTLSESLVTREAQLQQVLESFDASAQRLGQASEAVGGVAGNLDVLIEDTRGVMANTDRVMTEQVPPVLEELGATAASFREVAEETRGFIEDNREPLRTFSTEGLEEFSRLMSEARILIARLTRIAERLEEDGVRFLLGDDPSEFEIQ